MSAPRGVSKRERGIATPRRDGRRVTNADLSLHLRVLLALTGLAYAYSRRWFPQTRWLPSARRGGAGLPRR